METKEQLKYIKQLFSKEKTSYSIYWFKPGCVWRRKLWLKRLIKKLKKDVK